jgi:tetratricopeptide (TPR) repeat protein
MRDITRWIRQCFASHGADAFRCPVSWLPRILVCLLILTPLVVFWQVHSHEFVLWDDPENVSENPYLQALTLDHLLAFWRAPYQGLYIPLTYTLWSLTAAVSRGTMAHAAVPLNPQLFHSLNLLIHLASGLVVWRIVRLLLKRTIDEGPRTATRPTLTRVAWAACGGALLFAIHPIQVEAVAWVTGLKDVLCGFLSFVAIWQYLEYASGGDQAVASGTPGQGKTWRSRVHFGLATGVFGLALLAKPTAVVVPMVAWVLDLWGWPQSWRKRMPAVLVWLVLAVLWSLFIHQVQPATTVSMTVPLWTRPLIAGDAVVFYLYKLGVPIWLVPDYGRSPDAVLAQGWLWPIGLVPWGLAVWLWYKRTRVPWLAAAVGVWVAGLLPVLGFVPFAFQGYSTVADRYMYIAMLGPALALAWGLAQAPRRWIAVGCAVVLGSLGVRSAWQTRYWYDTVSLFEHTLAVRPSSALAHNNLGIILATQNHLAEASDHFEHALAVYPGNALAHNNLGIILATQNHLAEAIDHYATALHWWPQYAEAHNNLGNALRRQGRTQEAIQHYREALRLKPMLAEVSNNLAAALADQGQFAEAIHYYTEALRLQPQNAEAHNRLGNVLASQGQTQEALRHYMETLRLDPTFAEAHNNLGTALGNQGRFTEAIHHYTEALRLRPSYARAHYNLGNVLNRQGKIQEAIQQYTEALRLQPDLAEAHHNLGATLADAGHIAEAIEHYTEALRLRPRYVNAHYNLGIALAKQGRLAEARQHFAEVLRLDPTHAAARQFLESSRQ